MSDGEKTTSSSYGPTNTVVEIAGRRLFAAQRLTSGNWLLIEKTGISRRTINNKDFSEQYQRVPEGL